jgi:hypothetical protein
MNLNERENKNRENKPLIEFLDKHIPPLDPKVQPQMVD